jgi:glycosyltransferase involved in cell wall biosynthesis
VDGKFLRVDGRRFFIKGVAYGSFRPNEDGEPYPSIHRVRDDFARMRDAGINTVRLFSPPSDRIVDAAAKSGLHLIPEICWGPRRCELDDPERLRLMRGWTREHARRLCGHPSILMVSIGNEIPPLIVRWYGRKRVTRFLRSLHEIVKEEAPQSLVTYVSHPPTEHLALPFLDVVSYNVYLEKEREYRAYLARLHNLAGDRPLFLAETGLDSHRHGEMAQARFLDRHLRAAFEMGLCGTAVYGWTDEWAVFDQEIRGWSFGLTDADRRPRPALEAVRRVYATHPHDLRGRPWPSVSVVVASYNGAATLGQCLSSLERLSYPDYEVIVVDDGSTDATGDIARRHRVRYVRSDRNGGLSRARNLGIEAARGEIIAFIDCDAYADPDWLRFLVLSLVEHGAAGTGGPNLSPPEDGFLARCVNHAPGNPTHVLLDDVLAEHVPGCNMAFRKDALQKIGLFNPTHRTAGDDVEICWKLQVHDERIAFSPAAIVWHHRRGTIRAFMKQQMGYGFAEARLKWRYPGRFNVFGHSVWRGSLYDAPHRGWRFEGLPLLLQPRIYQGRFGSALFQSLYEPCLTWWYQVFCTVEWQVLGACVALSGLLALSASARTALPLLAAGAAMAAATLGASGVAAARAIRAEGWRGRDRWQGFATVAFLHVVQPLARAAGRLRATWNSRRAPDRFPDEQRLWGDLAKRDSWLERLEEHLRSCGWISRPCSEWDAGDLAILGPGPYTLKLSSVYEEELERGSHFVRYRVTARLKPAAAVLAAALLLALPALARTPFLLPLALPDGFLLGLIVRGRRHMLDGVSQMALECAEAQGMSRVARGG